MNQINALALFSGGLDSILACRVVAAQGIRVQAVKFVTPFFGHNLLADQESFRQETRRKYGIEAELLDLSEGYIELLRQPAHGFGKNFNPCIDCKILMLRRARELMVERGASFLITGEVRGQRPMSQHLDTLHLIEKEAGCQNILLRPLSARLLPPTLAEQQGLVQREQLYGFAGRGRKGQLALARELGISDFPAPAGGCVLTDPILAARIQRFYAGLFAIRPEDITVADIRLLLLGRQFRLPGGHWLVLGRNEQENNCIAALRGPDDWLLFMPERSGPLALLRRASEAAQISAELPTLAAGLVVRYGQKINGSLLPGNVLLERDQTKTMLTSINPLPDTLVQEWVV
ncbi:thiamine biosynthesis protein [Candidatus Electronema sp. PJ]|uniref:thiamine biosynthesis protein n=1 Tax=Candidatus Electronema sp. PJ TaxID=3401572 RepID=UPI003AA96E26